MSPCGLLAIMEGPARATAVYAGVFCAKRFAANMPTEETIMNGKIVSEEHIEPPDFPAIGDHTFTNPADPQNVCTTTPCESSGDAKWS